MGDLTRYAKAAGIKKVQSAVKLLKNGKSITEVAFHTELPQETVAELESVIRSCSLPSGILIKCSFCSRQTVPFFYYTGLVGLSTSISMDFLKFFQVFWDFKPVINGV